ncbi:hypothetical protein D8S78_18970 [Natrialba swarupiae]|nr:hypothetical protein [Natrialba swarupiae]
MPVYVVSVFGSCPPSNSPLTILPPGPNRHSIRGRASSSLSNQAPRTRAPNRRRRARPPIRGVAPRRIERTYLRTRVAALESELEASERRRQDVIEQYERILENWRADASSQDGDQTSEGPLGRLLDGWR